MVPFMHMRTLLPFLVLLSTQMLVAQSQAFKRDRPREVHQLIVPSDADRRMLEAFVLIQEANTGVPAAQHELGLRYLFGKGFPADTSKAVFWISRAAMQGMGLAQFNLGILQSNGYGTEWDPFEAFRNFRRAAEANVPEGLFITGLCYTENFVVPRNWPEAYTYFRRAADQGHDGAREAAKELERRGLDRVATTDIVAPGRERPSQESARVSSDTTISFLFVDFNTDTVTSVPDSTLLREAMRSLADRDEGGERMPMIPDTSIYRQMIDAAANGNPEAHCVVGRMYEEGIYIAPNALQAAVHYLRAVRLDSYRAPGLLWKISREEEFVRLLKAGTDRNSSEALYVWSGLTALKFTEVLSTEQALRLLERAAAQGFVPAMIELGWCAMTGRWMPASRDRARSWWEEAARRGDREANIRLAVVTVLGDTTTEALRPALAHLDSASANGSLIADVALAYAAERGLGRSIDKGEAYRMYHRSMRRGSEAAFQALRNMHDAVRPDEPEFLLPH